MCAVALLGSCTMENKGTSVEYKPVAENTLRAPAYPLVTIDPYTSLWSFTNNLNDEPTRHWTGRNFPVVGGVRVDGVNVYSTERRMVGVRLYSSRMEIRQGGFRNTGESACYRGLARWGYLGASHV